MTVMERIAHLLTTAAALAEDNGYIISIENDTTTDYGVVLDRTSATISISTIDE